MGKASLIGGGVLLALVVGLAVWIGSLRGQVKDGATLTAEITRQYDEYKRSAEAAAATARGQLAVVAQDAKDKIDAMSQERDASNANLAASEARVAALTVPTSLPDCMDGLAVVKGHVSMLNTELSLKTRELRYTNAALVATESQVAELNLSIDDYAEAIRLGDARFDAIELTDKVKRKKRIVGYTLGSLALTGAAFGGGYALAKARR